MKRVIEIALEERANLSIAEAVQIYNELGAKVNDDQAIREAVLKLKFTQK